MYERKRADQPGLSSRDDRWWDADLGRPRVAPAGLHEQAVHRVRLRRGVDGYAIWRAKSAWTDAGPDGETKVLELVAATPEAYAELWRFLLSIDLARTLIAAPIAVDEPLFHLVDEPRGLRSTVADGLWIRVVDVPAALAARRYGAPADVVLEVTDALLPRNQGRWRVRVATDGTAACVAAGPDGADLAVDVADLGALYLGGTPLGALAAAGRVRELTAGALRTAGAAFGWHVGPTAIEIF